MADSIRGTLLDSVGRPIASALVKVYLAGTSNLASIFSDKTLATPIVNDGSTSPLTEADGSWGPYYSASGRVDVKFAKTGYAFDDTDLLDIHIWDEEQAGAAARIITAAYQGMGSVNVQAALEEHEKEKATFADDFQDHVVSGLLGVDPGASLTMTIPGGTAYVIGIRVVKAGADADLTRTYTASKDTYVDISNTGAITYSEVANGAGAPAVAGSSIRLEKVVTNGTEITSVVDLRPYILKPKIVDIGDWNMDADASVNVLHGLTLSKIRKVSVQLRDDSDSNHYEVAGYAAVGVLPANIGQVNSTIVVIDRTTGGFFDSVGFDATSYNRGWITIWYSNL